MLNLTLTSALGGHPLTLWLATCKSYIFAILFRNVGLIFYLVGGLGFVSVSTAEHRFSFP